MEAIEKLIQKYVNADDLFLFNTGEAQKAYLTFGCHYIPELSAHRFGVFAPNARSISVVGDFNGWDPEKNPMIYHHTGAHFTFIQGLKDGDIYKYHIVGYDGSVVLKADPFAFHTETPPKTGSKVWGINEYPWSDDTYLSRRVSKDPQKKPMSVYEVHMGSWKKKEGYDFPTYREVADELAGYCVDMGYTHVELMPITEYPYDESWGYQVSGYFAPTSRYGTPQDFMYFVEKMHKRGIGVILDWVPAHFPKDEHALSKFDGTALFEHENPIQANHPQWGTLIFNYRKPEVVSFLVSSAMFWFDYYHVDGIRVDAVTSMLYLNYARSEGQYIPNEEGGNIDLYAVEFLKKLNSVVLTNYAGCITVAEESTSYPMITKPPYDGGLGFSFKWNMGFMHDTLKYMSMDHYFRQFNHNKITFSMYYAFSENFVLAYSHDEVVHGKKSMLDKMFGDYWQKFASLRALNGFMFAHPGKKLTFMGSEFGQFIEWDNKKQLDWFLLDYPMHAQMQQYARELNKFYKNCPAFYEVDDSWNGFRWLNVDDSQKSALSFLRIGAKKSGKQKYVVCAVNFTPVVDYDFTIGIPFEGNLCELLNSDDMCFGGSGVKNLPEIPTLAESFGGFAHSARITLPPLAAVYFELIPTN